MNSMEQERTLESVRRQSFVQENEILGNPRMREMMAEPRLSRGEAPVPELADSWFGRGSDSLPASSAHRAASFREASSESQAPQPLDEIGDDIADSWFK